MVGQSADGYGEGFEQLAIKKPDGEIYVSFWESGKIIASSRNRNSKTALPIPDTAALCWKGCRLSKVFSLVGLETNTGIRDTGTLLDFLL